MTNGSSHDAPAVARGYDRETGAYHAHHDGEGSLCRTVYWAVGAVTGVDPSRTELFPGVENVDALADVFRASSSAGRPADHVTVGNAACEVTVYRNGHVVVRPRDPDS